MIQSTQKKGNVTLIALSGTLEVGKQAKLKEEILSQINPRSSKVILDFKEVDFIDSSCLGALISVARNLRTQGGDIRIANLQSEVRSVFQITRLDKVFKIFDETQDALTSFNS